MSSLKSKSIYLATNNTKLHEFYLEYLTNLFVFIFAFVARFYAMPKINKKCLSYFSPGFLFPDNNFSIALVSLFCFVSGFFADSSQTTYSFRLVNDRL